MNLEDISARKTVAGSLLLVVGLVITFVKGDIPPNLLSFLQVLYATFVAGATVEHFNVTKANIASQQQDASNEK